MSQLSVSAPVYDAARVAALLGLADAPERLAALVGPPPSPCKGFITFFDPGWSILAVREIFRASGAFFCPQSWYDIDDFARRQDRPRYRQLRSEPLPGSLGKTFAEQSALLAGENVPPARVVVMGTVIHFLAVRRFLFCRHFVRCGDDIGGGRSVVVKNSDRYVFAINDVIALKRYWAGRRRGDLGLASARKVH